MKTIGMICVCGGIWGGYYRCVFVSVVLIDSEIDED